MVKNTSVTTEPSVTPTTVVETPDPNLAFDPMIQISAKQWNEVQDQLKMLYEVADKNRVFNYEAQRTGQKKPLKIKLSRFRNGTIIGWRTVKDELVKHPTTGLTVGEVQQYEVLLRDDNGNVRKELIDGYKQFSDARYLERIECEVTGKKEDWDGKVTFDVKLPDGKSIPLDSRFVN